MRRRRHLRLRDRAAVTRWSAVRLAFLAAGIGLIVLAAREERGAALAAGLASLYVALSVLKGAR